MKHLLKTKSTDKLSHPTGKMNNFNKSKSNKSLTIIGRRLIVISMLFLFLPGCVQNNLNNNDSLSSYQKRLSYYGTRQGIDYTDPNKPLDILRPVTSNNAALMLKMNWAMFRLSRPSSGTRD